MQFDVCASFGSPALIWGAVWISGFYLLLGAPVLSHILNGNCKGLRDTGML